MMRAKEFFSLLLTIVAIGVAQPARAVPIALEIDPIATSLTLRISSSAGNADTPFEASGIIAGEALLSNDAPFGPVVTQLELLASQLDASHDPLSILGAGVSLTFASENLGMSVTGSAVGTTPVAPSFSIGDFRDYVVALDNGTIFITGNVLGESIDESLDLTLFPIEFTLPLNSIGQIHVLGGNTGLEYDVTVPINATSRLFVADLAIDITLAGHVDLRSTAVPEPGTGVLLGTGLAVAGAARRRRAI